MERLSLPTEPLFFREYRARVLLSRGRRYFAINFNTLFFERVPPQRENQLDYLLSTYVCVLFLLRSALKKELIHILPNTRPFFLPQNAFVSRFFVTV